MGRAKLTMEPITEDKKRTTTYRNRKKGIIKKANELSLLCDVDTAIIVYPPPASNHHPEIWPQDPDQIKNVIRSYKEEKNEIRKRTYGLSDYFQDRKRKIEEELVRARKRNVEAKYPTWFDDLNGLSEGQLRQFAMELEDKKNAVKAHLEDKKRNLNVAIENNQPSSSRSVGSLDHVEAFNHDDDLLMSQWFDDMPDLQMPFENNQPSNPSYPSLDQVQTLNPDLLMSQVIGRFNDMPDLQKQLEFELGNKQQANNSVDSYTSPDQGGSDSMMSHDFGWFNDAPTTWSIPERSGFGYPVFGCDVVCDKSKPCPCQTLEQCTLMPEELALQDSHDGVGDGLNF